MKLGTDLTPAQQREVLACYVYRSTPENTFETRLPESLRSKGPLQFKDDADWLTHTEFAVTKAGNLHRRARFCHSTPTWPNNPELR